ncbi:MAG: M14 family metallopeptidase [candidate division KSB1 bacterium]|nr:M14 family metallopeptidase [candidate division KSB1 bacterium]MDZ7273100.1 M14 family metallopeptidase [candidate division KSB1 bacterium]MDZ7285202.1 M14 family metallopeptidase [candidate division KSB1 bacterium]MDZ7298234.1 M14 family metallopeptidase [candidate division KSB1 bacterium]MDZ7306736.1 M14 family metallopeptidase [candidate division KSB1 bacterium]
MSRTPWLLLCPSATLLACFTLQAQILEFYPGAVYHPAIPTLKQVIGHDWAEKVTLPHEAERYLQTLTGSSPHLKLVKYAESWEGRALHYLIVASEKNMRRRDEIKKAMRQLAAGRGLSPAQAEELISSMPVIVWLSYGVHGNEISSPEAALLLAYHLTAAQNDSVRNRILENCVVIIDPLQNPDGRDRYVNYLRQTQGRWPDEQPLAAEHNEPWPSGRTNHYLFDMNRDWFALTQPETAGRVRSFLEWYPQVFVDLHEMGFNQTYYFPPPANPHNPNLTAAQIDWLTRFGRNNAKWFDRFRFDYFTREIFDSFYPGYGEGWPLFQGALGMTYEQAGPDGLVIRRQDDTLLRYREAVQHHFIASLATAEMAASQRGELLRLFFNYRREAIAEGTREAVKEYVFPPGRDPNRTARLAGLLLQQGIEVKRAEAPFSNPRVRDYFTGALSSRTFPAGTFVVSLAQPAKRLVRTLLDRRTEIDQAFIAEQLQRRKKRLPDEFYDVTAWSLPLLYGVECHPVETASTGNLTVLQTPPRPQGRVLGGPAPLAYLLPWGSNSAAAALAALLQQNVRVHTTDKEFVHNGVKFPRGSLIIKSRDNPADLFERLQRVATEYGVEVHATASSWVTEGVNFGSNQVRFIPPPRVALAYHLPTNPPSAGWTRFLLEQQYGYPVTIINTWQLDAADLDKFNVLILPDGSDYWGGGYTAVMREGLVQRLQHWIRNGGTLITFGDATRWLTEEKVGLLATSRELRSGKPERKATKDKEEKPAEAAAPAAAVYDYAQAVQPKEELPEATPGALLRIELEPSHWLSAGYEEGYAVVMVESRNIYTPLTLDKGVNVGVYAAEDRLIASGFTWESSRKQLANKAYLMYQPLGQGHVVAFAEDPNYRAFMDGLNLLFLNAVLFGPAH